MEPDQRRVIDHRGGPLLVVAGPGTGKTTVLVETAVDRITRQGIAPEKVLLLTYSRRAAADLRQRITSRVGKTMRQPLARSFHSYAFGVLRRHATLASEPPPRLLSGPEQDLLIRELLLGDAEAMDSDGRIPAASRVLWPTELRPALLTHGFADELRDLMQRAIERGMGPDQLADYAAQLNRQDWYAAAGFLWQYLQVTALSGSTAYDPAELIAVACQALSTNPDLLAVEQERCRHVFVDEYQETDPAQRELLRLVTQGAQEMIAAGDPDQSIFGFRGADPGGIRDFVDDFQTPGGPQPSVMSLTTSKRAGSAVVTATRRVAERLSGPARHRQLSASPELPAGQVEVHLVRSVTEEAAYIAEQLRSAHLRDGIAWNDMAVLTRSASRQLSALRRALACAGVPCDARVDNLPLASQPAVRPLLLLLRCALSPKALDEDSATELLTSPLGGVDALGLRRLRRVLREFALAAGDYRPGMPLLATALDEPRVLDVLPGPVSDPARRIAGLIGVARVTAHKPQATIEDVLWAVWSECGLAETWQQASLRGGVRGAAADRDMDAVGELFAAAARFVDRLPGSGPMVFLDQLAGQEIPGDSISPRAQISDAVHVLTVHAAKGLEWKYVVVAGVQEGVWPDLRKRGTLLGTELLVDLAAGRDPRGLDALEPLLLEERRLFYVAVTRARQRLLVTAVRNDEERPSRFLDELQPSPEGRPHTPVVPTLSLAAMVAKLRSALADKATTEESRRVAARQLARLAQAGVPGANPDEWWGLASLSDERPLCLPGERVSISPSHVEKFGKCELRWLVETAGGAPPASASQSIGTVIHDLAALTADPTLGTDEALRQRLDSALTDLDLGGVWQARKEQERAHRLLGKFLSWLYKSRGRLELVGVEIPFSAPIGRRAVIRGRVDRLERDHAGRFVVIDLKTGRSAPPDKEVATHPQLGTYQLAIALGGLGKLATSQQERGKLSGSIGLSAYSPEGESSKPLNLSTDHLGPDKSSVGLAGGAALVQLGGSTAAFKEQPQLALLESEDPDWARRMVEAVAEGMAGAAFRAMPGPQCRGCPVRISCPAHNEGRQVTS